MDVSIPKQIFTNTQLVFIIGAAVLGSLAVIYANGEYQIRRFRRIFAKHFPEIPAEQCRLIIQGNAKLIRDMSSRTSRGLKPAVQPINVEKLMSEPLVLPKPSGFLGLKALLYIAETPTRIVGLAIPGSLPKETPIGSAVRASVKAISASLLGVPMLNLDQPDLVLRFRAVLSEWLNVQELPDEVSRAIRAGLKAQ